MSKNLKIVFIDRDGVINQFKPGSYVRNIHEFRLLKNVGKSIRELTNANYKIHIISNQQGVGKGLMTMTELNEITQLMLFRLKQTGGKIQSVNYCTHLESMDCPCRKPKPGLFYQALNNQNINLKNTWMIGDSWRDIQAGQNIRAKTILINNNEYKKLLLGRDILFTDGINRIQPDYCVKNLWEAVKLILQHE